MDLAMYSANWPVPEGHALYASCCLRVGLASCAHLACVWGSSPLLAMAREQCLLCKDWFDRLSSHHNNSPGCRTAHDARMAELASSSQLHSQATMASTPAYIAGPNLPPPPPITPEPSPDFTADVANHGTADSGTADLFASDSDDGLLELDDYDVPIFPETAPTPWDQSASATLTRETLQHHLEDERARKRARNDTEAAAEPSPSPYTKELFPNAARIIAVVTTYWQWLVKYRDSKYPSWPAFPFANSSEWSLAKFLCTSGLSKGAINDYLQTEWVRSFHSK